MERVDYWDLDWLADVLSGLRERSQTPDAVDFLSEGDHQEIRLVYHVDEEGED